MKKKINFSIIILFIITAFCSFAFGQVTESFTDPRDGKVYKTVKINDQVWMAENLAFKIEGESWTYDEVKDYAETHGYLYNWSAATKACPDGWRLPSMQDWWYLSNFLGGDEVSGGKLKETGTDSWKGPNTGATNSSGFTALPSGRNGDKNMELLGTMAYFWTNVDDDDLTSWCAELSSSSVGLTFNPADKREGYSVRCIQSSANTQERFDFW